jgi:hypothetical protein
MSKSKISGLGLIRGCTPLNRSNTARELQQVSNTAFHTLTNNLRGYGNELTWQHQITLHKILRAMTDMALGIGRGRIGIPLPIGGGKTQAAVCWSWAIWHLELPLSVVIACGRIDSLEELRNELLKLGVVATDHKENAWCGHNYDGVSGTLR